MPEPNCPKSMDRAFQAACSKQLQSLSVQTAAANLRARKRVLVDQKHVKGSLSQFESRHRPRRTRANDDHVPGSPIRMQKRSGVFLQAAFNQLEMHGLLPRGLKKRLPIPSR